MQSSERMRRLWTLDETELRETSASSGKTLLATAATVGRYEMAAKLIHHGIDVNIQDRQGKTPLHHAIENDKDDIAGLLVEQGAADIDIEDEYGNQPLLRAVFKGNDKVAKLLVQHGADPLHENKAGKSPLGLAREAIYHTA